MDRLVRPIRRHVQRARRMERFVQLIVAGGLAIVAGLWIATLTRVLSPLWVLGGLLVLVGIGGLGIGIWTQIES